MYNIHSLRTVIAPVLLQASCQSDKNRADEYEKKYHEAIQSSEAKSQKLQETEVKIHQLQESLNR